MPHEKRKSAPKHWPIQRKTNFFTFTARAGPHPREHCIPAGVLIRDVLGYAKNAKEIKYILRRNYALVDGRPIKKPQFPLGHQDVISFPLLEKHYRLVYRPKHGLTPYEISADEATQKLCNIRNKTIVKGGKLQLNLHDGRNITLDDATFEGETIQTRGTVLIDLPTQEVKAYFPLNTEMYALISHGRNMGVFGTILEISETAGVTKSIAAIETPEGEIYRTTREYLFIVGKDKPILSLWKPKEA